MHIGTFLEIVTKYHLCVNSPGPECDVCTSGAVGRGFGIPAIPRILDGRGGRVLDVQ